MVSSQVDDIILPVKPSHDSKGHSSVELPQEVHHLLETLAVKLWDGMAVGDVSVRPLKGALTNEVYECSWNSANGKDEAVHNASEMEGMPVENIKARIVVLVRVYGEGVDLFFDREDEIRTFEAVSKAGHGPRLLGRFRNGRIEEFLHARTLTAEDLRDPDVSARIAVKLREFHQVAMPGLREARIWERLKDWLQKALNLSSSEHVSEFRLRDLAAEIEDLRLRLSKFSSELGFCHNDLQYGNIMMDDEDRSITIIDYEYSTYNPVAYDLANHFCEMAANYHTDTPHVLDYSNYPDLQERRRFIKAYLGSSGDVSPLQVDQLAEAVDGYVLASHIHWGLWGIISAYVNLIDFDYLEYARQRFKEYYHSISIISQQ